MFGINSTVYTGQAGNILGPPVGTPVAYRVVLGGEEKPRYGNSSLKYKVKCWPITFMDQYANKSFEELRFEDYCIGRKYKIINIPSDDTPQLTTAMSNFAPTVYTLIHDIKMTKPLSPSTAKSNANGIFGLQNIMPNSNSKENSFGGTGYVLGSGSSISNFNAGLLSKPHGFNLFGSCPSSLPTSMNTINSSSFGTRNTNSNMYDASIGIGSSSNCNPNLGQSAARTPFSFGLTNNNNFGCVTTGSNLSFNNPLFGPGINSVPSKPLMPGAFNSFPFVGNTQNTKTVTSLTPSIPSLTFGNGSNGINIPLTPFGNGSNSLHGLIGNPVNTQASNQLFPTVNTCSGHLTHPITNLYPVFTNGRLVGYTTNEITFNPALKTEPLASEESKDLEATWKHFYEYINETNRSIYPSIKIGEFILDENPDIKRKAASTFAAYDAFWNNPCPGLGLELDPAPADFVKYDNVKKRSVTTWETVNFQLDHHYLPFIQSKSQQQQRRSLLQSHNIFKSKSYQNHIEQNSKLNENFTVFSNGKFSPQSQYYCEEIISNSHILSESGVPYHQAEINYSHPHHLQKDFRDHLKQSVNVSEPEPPAEAAEGAFGRNLRFGLRKQPNKIKATARSKKLRMNDDSKNEHEMAQSILCPESLEKERSLDEDLIPLLSRTNTNNPSRQTKKNRKGDDIARVDRSRRPRSKSLSIRPKGKSCGVHLTRERYYCIPSISTMDRMVDDEGRCIVENFEVGHLDYGNMVFQGEMDVAGINLDELIVFKLKEMFLYPATDTDSVLPLRLQKLNQPAVVTLFQVWPQRIGTNEFIRDVDSINTINYENLLRKTCDKMGVSFLSYDPTKGQWQFRIQDKAAVSQDDSKN